MRETEGPKSGLKDGSECKRCGTFTPPNAVRCPNCAMPPGGFKETEINSGLADEVDDEDPDSV